MSEDTTVLFLRDVPQDLKQGYKAFCARRGRSMKEDFIMYMKSCVRKDRSPPQKLECCPHGPAMDANCSRCGRVVGDHPPLDESAPCTRCGGQEGEECCDECNGVGWVRL